MTEVIALASTSSGVLYVTPIEPTPMQRTEFLVIVAVVSLIVFWPTFYALIKRRWFRAFAYFCLTLPVIWVTLNSHHWWGPVEPDNDFSPLKNGLYYYIFAWPVLTAVLWTITAVSDVFLALENPRPEHG